MKISLSCLFALALAMPGLSADETDQATAGLEVAREVRLKAGQSKDNPVELLEMIDREVTAHPELACEIVKAAILGAGCDEAIVGYVVETAVRAAPEQMRLISQCAIATAPDALAYVQEVMARLDPSAGEKGLSAKSAKSAKDAKGVVEPLPASTTPADPLDIPIVIVPPLPPIITPPVATDTELRSRR
jgi:hypothetical protein